MSAPTFDRWSPPELDSLRATARRMGSGFDLTLLAGHVGRPAQDVNQALDALLGRGAADAAAWLNRAGGGGRALRALPDTIGRFLAEMFR